MENKKELHEDIEQYGMLVKKLEDTIQQLDWINYLVLFQEVFLWIVPSRKKTSLFKQNPLKRSTNNVSLLCHVQALAFLLKIEIQQKLNGNNTS